MTLMKAIMPTGAPAVGRGLPAGNAGDVWSIFRIVRDAAASIGLKGDVIRTLETMVGFLRPGKGLVCFASNLEIQRRMGGVSDKTIRRHAAKLAEAGLLRRIDSPNGKRFSSRDPLTGDVEAYGFDLAPMVENVAHWSALLAARQQEDALRRHLRTVLLARLARLDASGQTAYDTDLTRLILRRKLGSKDVEALLAEAENALRICEPSTEATALPSSMDNLSVSAGQNDRDHSMSKTEDIDKKTAEEKKKAEMEAADRLSGNDDTLLGKVKTTCKEALMYATEAISTWADLERHASRMAPMIGIDASLMEIAHGQYGPRKAAISILLMVQMHDKVRNMRAYYRSLVAGRRRNSFDPMALLNRLGMLE